MVSNYTDKYSRNTFQYNNGEFSYNNSSGAALEENKLGRHIKENMLKLNYRQTFTEGMRPKKIFLQDTNQTLITKKNNLVKPATPLHQNNNSNLLTLGSQAENSYSKEDNIQFSNGDEISEIHLENEAKIKIAKKNNLNIESGRLNRETSPTLLPYPNYNKGSQYSRYLNELCTPEKLRKYQGFTSKKEGYLASISKKVTDKLQRTISQHVENMQIQEQVSKSVDQRLRTRRIAREKELEIYDPREEIKPIEDNIRNIFRVNIKEKQKIKVEEVGDSEKRENDKNRILRPKNNFSISQRQSQRSGNQQSWTEKYKNVRVIMNITC